MTGYILKERNIWIGIKIRLKVYFRRAGWRTAETEGRGNPEGPNEVVRENHREREGWCGSKCNTTKIMHPLFEDGWI